MARMTKRLKKLGTLAISSKIGKNVCCATGRVTKPESVTTPFWRNRGWKARKREIMCLGRAHAAKSFRNVGGDELWRVAVEALALNLRLNVEDCWDWEYLDIRMTILALDCELKPATVAYKVDQMRKCVDAFAKCERFAGKSYMSYHEARHRAYFILATWESELAKRDSDIC